MKAMNTMRRSPLAFTLVELLVVIGIIAVLVSILLPTLGSARRSAMGLKCATTLRELGNSIAMYTADNKGVLPPSQLRPATGQSYNIDGVNYPVTTGTLTTHAMWTAFIAKYCNKGKGGMAYFFEPDPDKAAADNRTRSIFWCPSWDGYERAITGQSGVVMWQTGYGFNTYLLMKAGDTSLPAAADMNFIQNLSSTGYTGKFIKITPAKDAGRRALLGDGQFWLLEAGAPLANGKYPGQKTPSNSATYSTSPYDQGQTLFDWYRHGKTPPIEAPGSAGHYKADGGKVSYNILYVDGHVSQSASQRDSYESIRMKYPG